MSLNKLIKSFTNKSIGDFKTLLYDLGTINDTIIVAGMGRSGTTWGVNIINHDNSYRVLFEPFFPASVVEAEEFEYVQYISRYCSDEIYLKGARNIISGKLRNDWIDQGNHKLFYKRRILKDIRCNLMLGWLKENFPRIPIVVMVRHPLQVIYSWLKLGWGKEAKGERMDYDIIISQKDLLNDFPIIREIIDKINPKDHLEKLIILWCIYHYVPSKQLKKGEAFILFYENLIIEPEKAIENLFKFLNKRIEINKISQILTVGSVTNFQNRDYNLDRNSLLFSWKDQFSIEEIQRTYNILSEFKLDSIYNKDGLPYKVNFFL